MMPLSGPALEILPVDPPHAFCPWFSGRNREWGVFGESSLAEERNFKGTIDQYLESRNDDVPLIISVQLGNNERVRQLLELRTEINSTGREGETALHMAAALGNVELVRLLCEHQANVSALTEDYSTPLLHCARFCGSPDAALLVANILLAHGADPRTAVGECTPLYYALRRPLIPLAERLISLTNISSRASGNINPFLLAALDAFRFRDQRGALDLFLQHGCLSLQERDIINCVEIGGLPALDAVINAQPPVMCPSPSEWLRAADRTKQIAHAALPSSKLHRRPTSATIAILARALHYGLDPSDLVLAVCEYEDKEVLEWATERGVKLTTYPKEDLLEMIRYLPRDWRETVSQVWDAQSNDRHLIREE